LFVKAKANPEIPTLDSYSGSAPESFWEKFPKTGLPSQIQTKINTEVLDEKIEAVKSKMLPHQFARAKKALNFLRYGAPAYQKISLPGCKVSNTPSTAEYGADVADTIASWVKKGFASGPFSEPPLDKFRVNCLMAVNQGSKVRPILNISLPENCSFNDNVDEFELEKVKMCSAKSFSHAILAAGKGAKMYKTDVRDAYKLVPAKIEDLRLQGFAFLEKYFCETRMAFGGKPSVSNYDIVGNTIFTLAKVECDIPSILVDRCVDDVPVVSPANKNWAEQFTYKYKQICSDLGIELAENCPKFEKAFENTTYGKVLGKFFDTEKLSWSLPLDKKADLIQDIHAAYSNKVNLSTLQSLLGKLNDVAIMCPFMKNFRHELNNELCLRIEKPESLLRLSYAAKRELDVWEGFLKDDDIWIPICPPDRPPPITALIFTSDAAGLPHPSCYKGKIGVASIGQDSNDNLIAANRIWWKKSFIMEKRDEKNVRFGDKTTTLEAVGLLLPFLTEPKKLVNKHIVLRVDNMACVYGFENRNCSGDKSASILLQSLHVIGAALGSKIYVEHAERRSDWTAEIADNLSREETTTEIDQFTLSRFGGTKEIGPLENWMLRPKPDWSLSERLVDYVMTNLQ